MKKMLIVAKSLGGGGSETAMIEFINHLSSKKYDLSLLLLDKDDEYKYRLNKKVKLNYIQFDNSFYHSLASMYSLPGKVIKKAHINKNIGIYDLLAKHTQAPSEKYDLAIDFYGYGAFTTAYLALKVNASHKAVWLHDEQMPWVVNSQRYFDEIDKICCVSQAIKMSFDKQYPKYASKSLVIYNVIDKKRVVDRGNEGYPEELNPKDFNIVTVGRLTEQKGYDVAISSAAVLKNKGLKFHWYGVGDGRDRERLEKQIIRDDVSDVFTLLGRRDNPYVYIKAADLYIQPSRHEGYSVAVTEARILKKIIIASNIPSNVEQIEEEKNGLVCELNAKSLADTIEKVYSDSALREKLQVNIEKDEIDFDSESSKIDTL